VPNDNQENSDRSRPTRVVVVKAGGSVGEGEPELLTSSGEAVDDVLSQALSGREHVVMVRVNDETLRKLDMLVESGLCSSRSGAAAFILHEGIESNPSLFEAVEEATDQITRVRDGLRQRVKRHETEEERS